MGNFYVNYTLRGPIQSNVANELAGRSAIVSAMGNESLVVYDEESDSQDENVIAQLGSRLSAIFKCPLLAVFNHDDDVLLYKLYVNGDLMDEYNSSPGYFDEENEESFSPSGGDAEILCKAFGSEDVETLNNVLHTKGEYLFAFERHEALVNALGISPYSVGSGYDHFERDELPNELIKENIVQTKDLAIFNAPSISPDFSPGFFKTATTPANTWPRKAVPVADAPQTMADLECEEKDFSEIALRKLRRYRDQFSGLNYLEVGYAKLRAGQVILAPFRENLSIHFLDPTGTITGQLIYSRYFLANKKIEQEKVIVVFKIIFPNFTLSCTNNPPSAIGTLPDERILRVESDDVAEIYNQLLENFKTISEKPRNLQDMDVFRHEFDLKAAERVKENVQRGVFIKMTDLEVEIARIKMKRAQL